MCTYTKLYVSLVVSPSEHIPNLYAYFIACVCENIIITVNVERSFLPTYVCGQLNTQGVFLVIYITRICRSSYFVYRYGSFSNPGYYMDMNCIESVCCLKNIESPLFNIDDISINCWCFNTRINEYKSANSSNRTNTNKCPFTSPRKTMRPQKYVHDLSRALACFQGSRWFECSCVRKVAIFHTANAPTCKNAPAQTLCPFMYF